MPRGRKRKVIDEKIYSVGIATLINDMLENISHYSGSKQECIDFLNKEITHRYDYKLGNAKTRINLAFDEAEFSNAFNGEFEEIKNAYKSDLTLWYTLDELKEIGAITIK